MNYQLYFFLGLSHAKYFFLIRQLDGIDNVLVPAKEGQKEGSLILVKVRCIKISLNENKLRGCPPTEEGV